MMHLWLMLAWMLTDIVATYGVWHYRRGLAALDPAPATPYAAILVAIKGVSETTAQFLEALCRQQYPAYRLVFALESSSDTALPLIEELQRKLAGRREVGIVIAGAATMRTQKVHNLLAALHALRDEDEIVVFADADILPDERWLLQLVRPVAMGEVAASSGYRWQLPADRRWPTLIVTAVDLSIATAARSFRWNLCWGGSLAIDRAALDQIDLASVWNRAASDDLTMTAALRSRGLKINAPLHVLVPSSCSYDWTSLFNFSRRQYLLARVYAPRHWLLAGWTLCLPALAAITALRDACNGACWWAMGWVLGSVAMLQVRLSVRRLIADRLLTRDDIIAARTTIAFARWAWPLIHAIHMSAYLASLYGRRFTWAGVDYRLLGKAVTVERRAGNALQIPGK